MNKKLLSLVFIILFVAIVVFVFSKNISTDKQQETSALNPVDVVLDFYEPWLSARQSTSTNPYDEKLSEAPILSRELREKIMDSEGQPDTEVDPVLCQAVVPTLISVKSLFEAENKSEVLVLARDEGVNGQAVVVLKKLNGGWYIDDIKCAPGEFGPPREFSFERDGFLVKDLTLPEGTQYLFVFEENNEPGHVVPLFFSQESVCMSTNGNENICNPDQFEEVSKVIVSGELSESGVSVKKMKFE